MKYGVRLTKEAKDDLLQLHGFLAADDLSAAERALVAITKGFELLEIFPFSCRKAQCPRENPLLRELIIPFGKAGYLVLFEIEGPRTVTVIAVRHQREDDYY